MAPCLRRTGAHPSRNRPTLGPAGSLARTFHGTDPIHYPRNPERTRSEMTTTDDLRPTRSNPYALSHYMDFDSPITVHDDGTVTSADDIYAPDLHDGELYSPKWALMTGYSGQYGYSGPIMHPSEFIGGRMANDILDQPGTYVALVDYPTDPDDEPDGWAVAYLLD